jgi:hypothetical protein
MRAFSSGEVCGGCGAAAGTLAAGVVAAVVCVMAEPLIATASSTNPKMRFIVNSFPVMTKLR